jgi:Lon protease-like protein
MADEREVAYTVKELLDRIERKVDNIDAKLDLKADRDRVHDVTNRLAALELLNAGNRHVLTEVSDQKTEIEDLKLWRNRLAGGMAVAVFLGGAAFVRALGVG